MSRFESKFDNSGDGPVNAAEILAALYGEHGGNAEERRDLVSRYLSGVEGWREASAHLDGAFAAKEGRSRPKGEE